MTPQAILFDAGGTLVTIDPGAFGDVVEPIVGARPDPDAMFTAHFRAMDAIARNRHLLAERPTSWWHWWLEQYLGFAGLDPAPEAVAALAATHGLWRRPMPGSADGVRAVKEAGIQVAVVSNADGNVADDLAAAGFGELFDVIVDSTVVGVSKPDPAIFSFALDALGVSAEDAWYVGDSPLFDLGGAQAAGMAEFVLIDPVGIHDGYQPSVKSLEELVGLLGEPCC